SPRVTRSSVKRWIIGTWWLAVLVLTSGFTGHMKASLTMKDEGGRLDTVHDIVVRPDVVPVIIKGTLFVELFRGTLDKDQQVVWARANRMKSIIPPKQVFTRETFDDVLVGKKVVFLEPSLFYYAVSNLYKSLPRGEFYLARERITNITMGMWINRGLPFKLRKALHQRTRWIIESGLPEKFRLDLIAKLSRGTSGDQELGPAFSFHAIKVEDVMGLFYLLLVGLAFPVFAFLAELVVYRLTQRHATRMSLKRHGVSPRT
ncbi:hypothetical protein HPB47_014654, partial [Ixodes persulcatus]